MKSRKLLTTLIVVLMVVSMVAGCHTNATPAPTAASTQAPAATPAASATAEATAAPVDNSPKGDPITFTMFVGNAGATQYDQDNPTWKWMTEQTGITLQVEYLVGDENTKVGVFTASGDYPDFMWGWEQHQKFIDAGAAIPLNDYIDKFGDNVKKLWTEKELNALKHSDGNIYYLCPNRSYMSNAHAVGGVYLQRRVLADAGYPKVTTVDQYFDLITAYAQKHPETNGQKTYAYSLTTDKSMMWMANAAAGILNGQFDDGYFMDVNPDTCEAKVFGNKDCTKMYWKKLNEVYLKGLLDPEAFTSNADQWTAKMSTGSVLGCYDQWWSIPGIQDSLKSQKMDDMVFVAVPATFDPKRPFAEQTAMADSVRDGVSISIKCKQPERAFKFMNWLLNENVEKRNTWGVEGTDYLVDSNGLFYRTPEMRKQTSDKDYQKKSGLGSLGYPFAHSHGDAKYSDGNVYDPALQQSEVTAAYDENDLKVLNAYGVKQYGEMFPQMKPPKYGVAWDINPEAGTDAQIAEQQILDLEMSWVSKLAMAPEGKYDEIWNQYLAEFEKINYKSVEKLITDTLIARVNSK